MPGVRACASAYITSVNQALMFACGRGSSIALGSGHASGIDNDNSNGNDSLS